MSMIRKLIATTVLVLLLPFAAQADVITTLIGDARLGVPDNLVVNVTAVDNGDGSYTVTVDLAPMTGDHDDVRLQNFFFNVVGNAEDYQVTILNPSEWDYTTGTNAQGSGGADFEFEIIASSGSDPSVEIGNSLVFEIRLIDGNIGDSNFTDAEASSSDVGSGSVGAHLISLNGSCSGFVWGDWGAEPTGPAGDGTETVCGGVSVPEPGTMGLLGLGLLGMALRRRKAKLAA